MGTYLKLFFQIWIALVLPLALATTLPADAATEPPATCSTLRFVAIEPSGPGRHKPCDPKIDRLACGIEEGFSRFKEVTTRAGARAYQLKRASPSMLDTVRYIDSLDRSPAIREVNQLRILARHAAGHPRPCEPNYIYLGSTPVFGMGPAFVSSNRFVLEGQVVTNVIVAEDARAPYHVPLAMLSKDSLIANAYYDIVIAHELAHGMMQDLYGVDEFAKLEKRVVSRDGHMASAVTDPTLAWIEGFAEGFEAYLGEKFLTEGQLATPYLDDVMQQVTDRMDFFAARGWPAYLLTIPGAILKTGSTLSRMDDFVTDFLKAERQAPVRDNHYVMQGALVNLAHRYGVFPSASMAADADVVSDWDVERDASVYSKEGVVAHFVYRILKEGLIGEVLETIAWAKPRDLWEFASELRAALDPERAGRLDETYKTIFTHEGRLATRGRLQARSESDERQSVAPEGLISRDPDEAYRARLARIPRPGRLVPPQDLWVEFWTPSRLHQKLYGRLDRINVSTATPGRVGDFLATLAFGETLHEEVLRSLLWTRNQTPDVGSIDQLARLWTRAAQKPESPLARAVRESADKLRLMRGCYLTGCLSPPTMK